MARFMSASRVALACVLLAGAGWVAMPLVAFLIHGPPPSGRSATDAAPVLARPASPPPRRVIEDVSMPPAVETSAPAAQTTPAGSVDGSPPSNGPNGPRAVVTHPMPPLPAVPSSLAFRPPPLDPTYRSTVEIPPPPLLDAMAPPRSSAASALREPPPRVEMAAWRETYAVRDGDDLTAIALRFYGSPAAAESIWLANQDRLDDPRILPIGLELRLPPPSSAVIPAGGRKRTIEPL